MGGGYNGEWGDGCAIRVVMGVAGNCVAWGKLGYCSWEQSCLGSDGSRRGPSVVAHMAIDER